MKSIRRSLIVYFLLLLGIALGAVCGLMYRTTYSTLLAKQHASEQLRHERFEDQYRQELAQRDLNLLSQARTLAGMTQSQIQWQRLRNLSFSVLGVLNAPLAPYGYGPIALWLAQSPRSQLSYRIHRLVATEIQLNEDFLPHHNESPTQSEFFQVATEWGNVWRSTSLGNVSMPGITRTFGKGTLFDWEFDDVTLRPGLNVRRVVMKAPLTRFRMPWPEPRPGPDPNRRGRPGMPPGPPPPAMTVPAISRNDDMNRFTESALPTIFIQCAWDTAPFAARLAELQAQRDADLLVLSVETQETLDRLLRQLATITILTFATVLIGGTMLIRSGLFPLRRLSNAVSQVTEKDFRLPVERSEMPRELVPIVDRLSQTLKMLEQAFEREKQSVADISHELRTPLASLMTTLEVALRKPRTIEQYRETLQDCRIISRQMSQLVERIMTLACLDANTVRWDNRPVDVTEMVDACATMVRPLAEANGITLNVERDPSLCIHTDPDKLREILINLLHNAVEYNQPGGVVQFTTHSRPDGVIMEVRDTGIGIPDDIQNKIFERFYRQDASRHATGIHAGLGLAIVKEYIARLGGSIAVESQVGVGSTFRVQLPDRSDELQPQGGATTCA